MNFKSKKGNIFLIGAIIGVGLFLIAVGISSSLSSCKNPLRCSIQDKLDNSEILSSFDNSSAAIQLINIPSGSCVCIVKPDMRDEFNSLKDGDNYVVSDYVKLYKNKCNTNENSFCGIEWIDSDGEKVPVPSCYCKSRPVSTTTTDTKKTCEACDCNCDEYGYCEWSGKTKTIEYTGEKPSSCASNCNSYCSSSV